MVDVKTSRSSRLLRGDGLRARHLAVLPTLLFSLAACGGGSPGVLDADDVPGASSSQEVTGPSRLMQCEALSEAEYAAALSEHSLTVELDRGSDGLVFSTVADVSGSSSFTGISEAIDECVAANGTQGTTTTRLEDLPGEAIGYEATSEPDQLGTKWWALVDDRIVGVGLVRSTEPAADADLDLEELLDKAIERSADFDPQE